MAGDGPLWKDAGVVAVAVRVLGPMEVDVGGVAVALVGQRQRAVVATLALAANRAVPADEVIRAVWGDDASDHAHRLQQQVSSVRKVLDPGRAAGDEPVLARVGPGYLLRCASVDIEAFEQAAADAASATSAGDRPGALAAFDRALSHWRGPALADVLMSSWFEGVAARLEERRLTIIEARLDLMLELGRDADVLDEVAPLVRDHPYREGLRGQQMLALYRTGRQTEALAVYRSARDLLVDELGIEPGTALRDLEGAILRQDPSLLSSAGHAAADDVLAATFRSGPLDRGHIRRPDGQVIVLLEGDTIVGRQPDAEVRLDDSRVSRRHARIECVGDRYRVFDLGSTNGTTVNGEPADGQELADGDVIGIGTLTLPFSLGAAGAAPPA